MLSTTSNTLCRTCLASDAQNPIFETSENSIEHKLFICLQEKIEDIEGYPRNICNKCKNKINAAYEFINTYKVTCKVLQCGELLIKKEKLCDSDNKDNNISELYDQATVSDADVNDVKPKIEPPDTVHEVQSLTDSKNVVKKSKSLSSKKKIQSSCKSPLKPKIASKKVAAASKKTSLSKVASKHAKVKDSEKPHKPNRINPQVQTDQKNTEEQKDGGVLCDLCGLVFINRSELLKHRKHVHFPQNLKCPDCPQTFREMTYLRTHQKRKHDPNKTHGCPVCGKKFAYYGEMNTHIKTVHHKDKRKKVLHTCSICNKKFACKRSVTVHMRSVHTGERPEVCAECGATFTHRDYLRDHMRLHTGETPFKCPVCDRGYAQLCNLKSHVKQHRVSELDERTRLRVKPQFLRFMKP